MRALGKLEIVAIALLIVSIAVCVAADLSQRRKIANLEATLSVRRAQLVPLAAIYREVAEFQSARKGLERSIDLIKQLKESQTGPPSVLRAWVWLARSPDLVIDSVTVGGDGTLHVNGRTADEEAIRRLPTEPVTVDPEVPETVIPPPEPEAASLPLHPELEEILEEPVPTISPHFRMEMQGVKTQNRCGQPAQKISNCVDFIIRLKVTGE